MKTEMEVSTSSRHKYWKLPLLLEARECIPEEEIVTGSRKISHKNEDDLMQ